MADATAGPALVDGAGERSIASFLTDGSVIRLCVAIGAVAGVSIYLLDADGAWLFLPERAGDVTGSGDVSDESSFETGTDEPWVRGPAPASAAGSLVRAPIRLGGSVLGEFVLADPGGAIGRDRRERLIELVGLLAAIAEEFCQEADAMRTRIRELGALFRLNSLLVKASDSLDKLLRSALELALGALGLDAGSIVLFPEDSDGVPDSDSEADVRTRASIGLSESWRNNPLPLSRGREFDRLVLSGRPVAVRDLAGDGRVLEPDRLEEENIRAFLSAALVHSGQAIGVMRLYGRESREFSVADQRLIRSIAEQSAIAVSQARLLEVAKRERAVARQMQLASAVQRRMQPVETPVFPGLDVAAKSEPSSLVGGDIYDVFERDGGGHPSLGLVIGDVVGKGLPAALLMSAVRASLRAHAHGSVPLEQTMARANEDMCRDTLANEFTTLWYGSIDPATRVLTYCSAGHEPPFIVRPVPGEPVTRAHVVPLKIGGLVIGVNAGEAYQSETVQLQAGDVLVAYTDGLPDARTYENEKWGMDRLVDAAVEAVSLHGDGRASVVLDQILWSLRRFKGLRAQVDDETLIVVRVR